MNRREFLHFALAASQYALLMNMPTYGGARQLVPHIWSEGGVTNRADGSNFPRCADYAASRSEVPEEMGCSLGFTHDGKYLRAYVNAVMLGEAAKGRFGGLTVFNRALTDPANIPALP